MKLYLHTLSFGEAYEKVKGQLREMSYDILAESQENGSISSYCDGAILRILDVKLSRTKSGLKLFILGSQLRNPNSALSADPVNELKFMESFLSLLVNENDLHPSIDDTSAAFPVFYH